MLHGAPLVDSRLNGFRHVSIRITLGGAPEKQYALIRRDAPPTTGIANSAITRGLEFAERHLYPRLLCVVLHHPLT